MVTTRATASPLEDDREVGVGGGDVHDLADALDGAGLERDVLDAGGLQRADDLRGLLDGRDTGGDTETFDRETLTAHLLPERELEAKLARVDVERVERDADASRDLALDLGDLRAESSW